MAQLEGPITIRHLVSQDAELYLLGDWHVHHQKCQKLPFRNPITVHKFIKDAIELNATSKHVDVFLEYYPDGISFDTMSESFLKDLIVELYPALQGAPDKVPARFHYTDLRQMDKATETIGMLIHTMELQSRYRRSKFHPISIESEAEQLLGLLRKWEGPKTYVWKIEKQAQFIQEPALKTGLLKELESWHRVIKGATQALQTQLETVTKSGHEWTDSDAKTLYEKLDHVFKLLTHAMDFYLLARMLRKYPDGNRPRFNIAYVGELHARFITSFLEKHGFKVDYFKESNHVGKDFQCIPLDPPHIWPFVNSRLPGNKPGPKANMFKLDML